MAGPFGVDLDSANFSSSAGESSSESSGGSPEGAAPGGAEPSGKSSDASPREASSRTGSERRSEFTREELEERLTGESPRQENQNAKFEQNFAYDLAACLKDPSRMKEFAQIYPREFVERAQYVMRQHGVQPSTPDRQASDAPWRNDPEYLEAMEALKGFKEQQKTARIDNIGRELDRGFSELQAKYPSADQNVINWYLQGLAQKGVQLMNVDQNGVPTTIKMQVLDKLFKQDHQQREAAYEKKYRDKIHSQKSVNRSAKDMGSGGSPSSAPGKAARTMKEAKADMLEAFTGNRT